MQHRPGRTIEIHNSGEMVRALFAAQTSARWRISTLRSLPFQQNFVCAANTMQHNTIGMLYMCMRAEKCLKTVSKLSIMVKQHIFNINSQSLLVEIIFIKRGNLLPRLVLIYVHKNFLVLLCAVLTRLVRSSRE
jgi:hypothetical protein